MASTYTELKKGATGNNVSALQTALNNAGYNVTASGSFDDATEAALKRYQTDNVLTADGIAGEQTLGRLYGTQAETQANGYTPSSAVTQAQKYLESVQANKPGAYQSGYQSQMDELLKQITTRGPFSYDVGSDPLYNIYKDRYIMNGQRAMQNAMSQAAALTGGYGNSYAQSVGQQQFNQYMEGLNDIVPDLEQRAYQRYQDGYDRLAQNYQMLAGADDRDYGRYQDDYNRYLNERDNAQNSYFNYYDRDYQRYADDRAQGNTDRSHAYQTAMSILQTGQMPTMELLAQAGLSQEDAAMLMQYYTPKSSGSGGRASGGENGSSAGAGGTTNRYYSTQNQMMRNNLGNGADILTAAQWAGSAPVTLPNGQTTTPVNPLAQTLIQNSKQNGFAGNTLDYLNKNYTQYAEDAIMNAYRSGQITGNQAAGLAQKLENELKIVGNVQKPSVMPKPKAETKKSKSAGGYR